ncbi:type I restriction enzyme S subunit [Paraburkholderia sp. UCT70]|uniref:restriction endonuclease subunit S n=1 Tax=Paraburkholderia sp. UCT70 TaxID=2991068 RepID=UPI003D2326D6
MDARQFLAEFGHIADAPKGVARLRELVLRLAVQGRLVPQNDLDEPAADFLSRSLGQIHPTMRRRPRTATIESIDRAQNRPSGWIPVSLNRLANPQAGFAFKANRFNQNGMGLPIIRVRDVGFNAPATYYSGEYRDEFLVTRGDWLIAMDGDFRVAVWDSDDALLNQRVTRLQFYSDEVNKKYVCIALQFELRKLQGLKNYTTVDHLSGSQIAEAEIALPPLQEQSRIVGKLDELMALCDLLDAQQQDRRKLQNALRQSTLQALAIAQSPRELQESWQRLQINFDFLFSEPADVRLLRDMLFDLALRGILLPQSKLTASDGEDRRPLPDGWEWKTLADLSEYITSGSRGWKAYMTSAGDSFIRSQDIRQDALVFENPAFVSLPERVEGKRTLVRPSDLLLTITGGNVGRCAVVPELPNSAYVSQHVSLIRLQKPSLSEFIHFWMINAFGGRAFLARYIYGDKPGLNLVQVGSVPIPVPPAHVLPDILTTLRRNRQLCDTLAEQLNAKGDVAAKLCTAAVATLTGIAIERKVDTSVKAPQTELIAPLRLGISPDVKAQAPLAKLLARHNGEMQARDLWQRFGGEIDAFYAQLKIEVAHGWITEPKVAGVREKAADAAEA